MGLPNVSLGQLVNRDKPLWKISKRQWLGIYWSGAIANKEPPVDAHQGLSMCLGSFSLTFLKCLLE